MALGLAAIMAMTAMTGCGGSSSAKTDSTTGGDKKQAEATSGKEKITLRIGSGHSESNPWITALEDYFVKNVSERVSEETNYEIDWVKSYGGSVISLGNELQGVQDGLVDIGCTILVVAVFINRSKFRIFLIHLFDRLCHNQRIGAGERHTVNHIL